MRAAYVLPLLLLTSSVASAGEAFEERVQRAKVVEESPEGKEYQQVLWKQIGDYTTTVMQQCFPKGIKADPDFFTLVGDVMPNRSLSNVELRPSTKMSECFAEGFGHAPFPKPPASFGEKGIPIEIEIKITP